MSEVCKCRKSSTEVCILKNVVGNLKAMDFMLWGCQNTFTQGTYSHTFFLSPEEQLLAEKMHIGKQNQGNCQPIKQDNTAKTSRTFSEVQQF